jgi:hypothetical protein
MFLARDERVSVQETAVEILVPERQDKLHGVAIPLAGARDLIRPSPRIFFFHRRNLPDKRMPLTHD